MSRRYLVVLWLLSTAPAFARFDCTHALNGHDIFAARLRRELGSGFITDQVKNAYRKLRSEKAEYPTITQEELAQIWRDYVPLLEEYAAFKSYETRIGKDIVFRGRRGNEYIFLAITPGPNAGIFYGVRTTPLTEASDWHKDNTRLEDWTENKH